MTKKIITSALAPDPIGPYNQAILVGNTLYVSGQIPYCKASQSMKIGTITEEAEQVMKNLSYIIKEAGFHFEDAVKATIFLKNMDDFDAVNQVYGQYFNTETAPARECVQVAKLPKDVNVEISMILNRS